jgi:hypothetical protein
MPLGLNNIQSRAKNSLPTPGSLDVRSRCRLSHAKASSGVRAQADCFRRAVIYDPPMPDQPPPPSVPAGWLPDPDDSAKYRYWDGSQWSDHWTKNPNKPTPWDHAPTAVTPATPRHRPAVLNDPARKSLRDDASLNSQLLRNSGLPQRWFLSSLA